MAKRTKPVCVFCKHPISHVPKDSTNPPGPAHQWCPKVTNS